MRHGLRRSIAVPTVAALAAAGIVLSAGTSTATASFAFTRVIIVGGTVSVSPQVEAAVVAKGIQTERLAGANRVETAAKVADFAVTQLKWPATHVDLSRGDAFPDSLAGGAHAGKNKAAAMLTESPSSLGAASESWLAAHASTLSAGHINGGTGAVDAAEATEAAKGTSSSSTSSTSSTLLGSSTSSSSSSSTSSTSSTSSSTTPTTNPLCGIGIPICD